MRSVQRWLGADAALVAGCLFLTVLAVKTPWSDLPPVVVAVAGALASLAQWWRRRWPGAAAVAGALGYALSGNPGPLLVGLYAAGAYAPRRHAWWLVAVGWAGATGWNWLDAGRLSWWDAAYVAVAAAATFGLGAYVATRRALQDAWRERAERADTERTLRDEQARIAERARIAREMHDVLAHKVSLIALHAGALELTADGGAERVREGAGVIRVTAREALAELRTVLGILEADAQPYTDLASVVADATSAGQRVQLANTAGELPASSARVVQRVVQEGLTNARKHAPGETVTVSVGRDADVVSVVVTNPVTGVGLELPGSGAGLVGLAERLRLVGGALESGPTPDGWHLRATIPYPSPEA
ncbi:sensor histidine kinase [Cryptosporangium arvum]|uniref:histidine kinase n=1 Tax=Cryptosporangium arvum DSM 44712 TaxID=927661 RepID=A0A010YLJ1_9ACTN|nr:histidine kinase [Cryptosporangium arvum]EXG81095.1 signal transduction histidine kinase [Cryptosporangium arvum DSM 44712]